MKCFSSAESFFQSAASLLRSTSSAVGTKGVCQERGMTLVSAQLPPFEKEIEQQFLINRRRTLSILADTTQRLPGFARIQMYSIRFYEGTALDEPARWLWCGLPVQKEASAFLYISHTSACLMGNMQKRSGFSASRGSISCRSPGMVARRFEPSQQHNNAQK